MILLNSTARVLGHLFVTGNINSTGSTVSISDHSIMNVAGNLILKNGVFVMTGSSFINVSGCLDLSNVSLVLSGNPQSNTFNLMSFSPNCTNTPTYSHIAYDNPMECRSYTLTDKSTNKQIIFSISYDDSKCNTFQLWWVILLTLVVLIGLIILMYFSTKNSKIHKIFFPFSDRKKHQSQITASLYAASLKS
uniref:Uncharacterized protein n=1 Tax=Arcella intermedia TaxID=1963864 RepID=A0A6B2L6B0_9EUKA